MPIYAYRCTTCGHAKDVLQKMSDPLLTVCPSCGAPTLRKQVTAAGFQLKGSGWYVTDFRDSKSGAKPDAAAPPVSGDTATKTTPAATDGAAAKPAAAAPAKSDATPSKPAAPPPSGTS